VVQRVNRRQQILECFASMLESRPGGRITTAALAAEVGVSEAALYRHFPSKAKMYEGLIEFMEETIFSRVNRIMAEESAAERRCRQLALLLLSFAERNPGFTRLMTGEALVGETSRLRERMQQFFDRLETQLRQSLREGEARGTPLRLPINAGAAFILALTEGRIIQFVRSDFRRSPAQDWDVLWETVETAVFQPEV
jgi:TetR/AcrR family transcriptional regulator